MLRFDENHPHRGLWTRDAYEARFATVYRRALDNGALPSEASAKATAEALAFVAEREGLVA